MVSRRHRKRKRLPRIEFIYNVQSGRCYLCNEVMPHPKEEWVHHLDKASLDHVIPKRPNNPDYACNRIRGNALVAHHGCNNRKANRLPRPCELIFLEAINARLMSMLKVRG